MTSDFNPYTPPTPAADAPPPPVAKHRGGGMGVWQEGGLLVLQKAGGVLPERCVVCNRKTDYKLKIVFSWHPPAYYLLAPLGGIIYSIVLSAVRKHAAVELGLCDEHRGKRRTGLLIAGLGAAASIVFFIIGFSGHATTLMMLSFASIVLFPVVGLVMARVASVSRIDDTHAWLKVGAPFLASLPTSPEDAWPSPVKPKKKKKKVKKAKAAEPERNESAEPERNESAELDPDDAEEPEAGKRDV